MAVSRRLTPGWRTDSLEASLLADPPDVPGARILEATRSSCWWLEERGPDWMRGRTTLINLTAVGVAAAVMAVGIGEGGLERLPVVEVTANEFFFQAPERAPAGLVRIRLTNRGRQHHHLQLVRLSGDLNL